MARVLSALALLPLVIGTIWLSQLATLVLAEVVLLLAYREYVALAAAFGASQFRGVTVVGVAATAAAVAFDATVVVLMASGLTIGASRPAGQSRVAERRVGTAARGS